MEDQEVNTFASKEEKETNESGIKAEDIDSKSGPSSEGVNNNGLKNSLHQTEVCCNLILKSVY